MSQSASFSGKDVESTSSNFFELREKGLDLIQKLSGDVWTDYNSHDPGVTILEQICYALTDIALRTSLPVEDLLTPGEGLPVDPKINAFFTPSRILSSHPVTMDDTRKMIIDQFDEIQNAWIITGEKSGYQEQVSGINQIEILPKFKFLDSIKSDPKRKKEFLNRVNNFLNKNRNLGEIYEKANLLEPQKIDIVFDIYIEEQTEVELTIANLFLRLLEFIYSSIQINSYNEMMEAGYSLEESFSGPRLKNGFIKNNALKARITSIHINELQKLFSKVNGISKCQVKPFNINGVESKFITVQKEKFFHLLVDDLSMDGIDNRFDQIYKNMTVFLNHKKLVVIDKQKINAILSETWSKRHRGYRIGKSLDELFYNKLKGTYRKPDEYSSIQRHFPVIYGIGEEGLSQNEPLERRTKALQLKTYLMLLEQHLANHLAQLGNLNEFFNIDLKKSKKKTYFTQWMNSIPDIKKLAIEVTADIESWLEPKNIFFDRKNRIYNHLLARFGEDLNDIPWKVALRLNLISSEDKFNQILLQKKSKFLLQLRNLSYNRTKGEAFLPVNSKGTGQKLFRKPSGLEQMILAKTGIRPRGKRYLFPDFTESGDHQHKFNEEPFNNREELNKKFRPLSATEIKNSDQTIYSLELPNVIFGNINLKTRFKETLNFNNYRLSKNKSTSGKVQVIFQKEKNRWVKLLECTDAKEAVQSIHQLIADFTKQNIQSEGIYFVDHILLSDILKDSKYGFSFYDKFGEPLFHTDEEESWYDNEETREDTFRQIKLTKDNYFFKDGVWTIKEKKLKIHAFKNENQKLLQLMSELNTDSYTYSNGQWMIKKKKSMKLPQKVTNKDLKLLNEVLEEVFEDTKKYTSRISVALDKNSYAFSNDKWLLRHENQTLASYKITVEDLKTIHDILDKQHYFFENGKWKIEYEDSMIDTYEINGQDLKTIIDILNKQDYLFKDGEWKVKYENIIRASDISDEEVRKKAIHILDVQAFSLKDGKWVIKYDDKIPDSHKIIEEVKNTVAEILCKYSCFMEDSVQKLISDHNINLNTLNDLFNKVYHSTKRIIQLFNHPEDENGQLRFNEIEKIRAKGSMEPDSKNYGQRRLVFQRKADNGEIVDEDFFNLNISVLMPDWPARFQIERFKDYVTDLIHQRIPAHIGNNILWLNAHEMHAFEEKYHLWEELKSEINSSKAYSEKVKSAAFKVYQILMELKKSN